MHSHATSRDYLAEYHFGTADAPHTEAYLWQHIFGLCAHLGARRVVDIGSGNGAFPRELARRGYEVVGCEPSADGVRFAQTAAPELVFHQLGVDDDPSTCGIKNFVLVTSHYLASANRRRVSYHAFHRSWPYPLFVEGYDHRQ